MALSFTTAEARTPIHAWLRQISVACVSGSTTSLLGRFTANLLECFRQLGHRVQAAPDGTTDALLTTARFGEILNWRQALLFTGRYRRDLFRLVMGINRWTFRVLAYAALMRDEYPPFRLDAEEPGTVAGTPGGGSGPPRSPRDPGGR